MRARSGLRGVKWFKILQNLAQIIRPWSCMCDKCDDDLIDMSCQTHKLVHNYMNI